jgi:addiction module HigA family antidote
VNKLKNIHPGEILDEEFIKPLKITAYKLSKETNIPQTRISEIIKGKRKITADTALRFGKFFGNSPHFWLGLQNDYDLEEEMSILEDDLAGISMFVPSNNSMKRSGVGTRAKSSR